MLDFKFALEYKNQFLIKPHLPYTVFLGTL